MKKLMCAVAAVAAGVAFAEEAPAVASANVVGYTTIQIQSKFQIIGMNFQKVEGGSIKLNDLIPYQDGMTMGQNKEVADQIQIGDTEGGWAIYYLSNGYNAKGKEVTGLAGKWAAENTYVVSDVALAPGDSFWYVRNDATKDPFTINVAGSVTTMPTSEITCTSKFRIFSNPYTTDLPINGGAFAYDETTMTMGQNKEVADQIQIGDAEGGWAIYYLSNGYNAKGKEVTGLAGKWAAENTYVVSDAVIPLGKSAWYVRKDTAKPAPSFMFVKPYDL